MSISRRHFEQIAWCLKKYNAKRQGVEVITRRGDRMTHGDKEFDVLYKDIADYLASENAQFSYSRFHDAVYPEYPEVTP
tara:strand:- start:715 stop:951 length:237 start_codon:yes stop_codon:yes gene_type:complete